MSMEPIDERNAEIAALKAALESFSKMAKELKKERDEAIADRDIARLSAQDSDRAHDRMVGELEKFYKERDDAVAECKSLWSLVNANKLRAYKAERERDEAWEAIVGWENKWKCAIEMAAKAEVERDEARDLAQQMSESNQVLMADVRFYRKAFEDAK